MNVKFFLLLFLFPLSFRAQVEEAASYENEEEGLRAYIINPGDLYSTFNLKDNASVHGILVDSEILSEKEFQAIVSRAKESGWPSGISTSEKRLASREKITEYVAYYLTDFGVEFEYTLLWIPYYENEHMPENMQPLDEEGFYFVIKSSAVEYDDF